MTINDGWEWYSSLMDITQLVSEMEAVKERFGEQEVMVKLSDGSFVAIQEVIYNVHGRVVSITV